MLWMCPDCGDPFASYSGVVSHHVQIHHRDASILAEVKGDEIREWYVEDGMSCAAICDRLDVSRDALMSAFDSLGIDG